jgi:adenosylcobinamide-phosphate guanylyltransferase
VDALVMAGGVGLRMGNGEKPMQQLNGRPMISYVIDALIKSEHIGLVHVAISSRVPLTEAYISKQYAGSDKVGMVMTPGTGYIRDTVYAVDVMALRKPFLIIASDLPLVTAAIIDSIVSTYEHCGKEALSVRVPADMVNEPELILHDTGFDTVPASINILDGAHMDRAQDEYVMVVEDPALTVNVNYRKDLVLCAELLSKGSRA